MPFSIRVKAKEARNLSGIWVDWVLLYAQKRSGSSHGDELSALSGSKQDIRGSCCEEWEMAPSSCQTRR